MVEYTVLKPFLRFLFPQMEKPSFWMASLAVSKTWSYTRQCLVISSQFQLTMDNVSIFSVMNTHWSYYLLLLYAMLYFG